MRYPARPIRVLVLPLPGPATISAGVGAAMAACWNSSGWEERSRGDEGDRKGTAFTMDEGSPGDEGDCKGPLPTSSTVAGDEGDRKGPPTTSSTAPALTMDESASSGDGGDVGVPTES